MGFVLGIIMTAAGAILAWAVNGNTSSVNINTIGYILLVVGIVTVLLSTIFWSTWAGPGYFSRTTTKTVDDSGHASMSERTTM